MENTINYQLENENIKLKIELLKLELENKKIDIELYNKKIELKNLELKEKELLIREKEVNNSHPIVKEKEVINSHDEEKLHEMNFKEKEMEKEMKNNPNVEIIKQKEDPYQNTLDMEGLFVHGDPNKLDKTKLGNKLLTVEEKYKLRYNEELDLKENKEPKITLVSTTPKRYIREYVVDIISDYIENQLIKNRAIIKETLMKDLKKNSGLKVNTVVCLIIEFDAKKDEDIDNPNSGYAQEDYYVSTPCEILYNENDVTEFSSGEKIFDKILSLNFKNSGMRIVGIKGHYINAYKYTPLKGGSYIELPDDFKNSSKGLVNIKNKDDKCFMWCHIAHLFPVDKNKNRLTKYDKHEKDVDYKGIEFPVTLNQIGKIEKLNEINFNIYTFDRTKKYIIPLYVSKNNYEKMCDMLLVREVDDDEKIKSHYVLITDLSKLLHNQNKARKRLHYCRRCLQHFYTVDKLNDHMILCNKIGPQKTLLPTKENRFIKFNNFKNKIPSPFVIYADFEALNTLYDITGSERKLIEDGKISTEKISEQNVCGYGYKLVCLIDDKFSKPIKIYRGKNAAYKFIQDMIKEEKYCYQMLKDHFNKKLVMTKEDEVSFINETSCHICNKHYSKNYKDKLKDHDRYTGKYKGSVHRECKYSVNAKGEKKLKFTYSNKLNVFFHNLRGYDSHFLMQEVGKFNKNITVIPNNSEKFLSFSIGNINFKDSYQFMAESLAKLSENLVKKEKAENNPNVFKYLSTEFKGEELELLKQKGIFPYEYLDSFDRFKETELPGKDKFYSRLNNTNVSDDDYNHAINVWNKFNMKTFGDYHDIYLKTDVLLLADIFENFRNLCLRYYKLDPVHYFSTPGIAWDACLKMTGQTLELITDPDMYLFVEHAKRGGMSFIGHRYAEANNKYMENFDPTKESSYLMYFDVNSLYSKAMCYPLPVGNFKWVTKKKNQFIRKKFKSEEYNFFVECDIKYNFLVEGDDKYTEKLHDLHNDYPLAPEKMVIDDVFKDLPYCEEIRKKFKEEEDIVIGKSKAFKLVSTLTDKKNYIVHAKLLEYYLKLGLKVKAIKILTFDEKPWMKTFIEFNIDKRIKATNDFEIEFFKLMNNSVYGKTMENVRKHCNLTIVKSEDAALKHIANPLFNNLIKINDNLIIVRKFKVEVKLFKPIYVGVAVLDYSKLIMYRYHYSLFKNFYGDKARLLMTDTDSLFYEIKTEDVYKDLFDDDSKLERNDMFKSAFGKDTKIKDLFDTSNFKKTNPYYSEVNKKVSSLLKCENADNIIARFGGNKSKNYAFAYAEEYKKFLTDKDKEKLVRCKGTVKSTIRDNITIDSIVNTIKNSTITKHDNYCIRSKKHQLGIYKINKVSLSCYDDKRFILKDGITSYAHGHYKIKDYLKNYNSTL